MKKIIILPVLALAAFVSVPDTTQALSCIDPEGMVEYIVSQPDSIVVTAKVVEQSEKVKEKATQEGMYDSGYTGQFLEISKAHMGTVPDSQWVYFERNSTWNYLCAGEPPAVGTENIYVINFSSNVFQPQTVTAVYPVGSDMAKKLLKAIDGAKLEVEPATYEVPKADWVQRLHDELNDMAFIIRVKLDEWKFWSAK